MLLSNPWLIVGALLALAGAAVAGYMHGINTEQGRAALEKQELIDHAYEAWEKSADAETTRRLALATQHERANGAAREAKLRGQLDAAKNDRPACRWPERRRLLINAAIDAANAQGAAPALGLHAPLPGTASAGQ